MLPQTQQAAKRVPEPASPYLGALSLDIRGNQKMDCANPQLGKNPGRISYYVSQLNNRLMAFHFLCRRFLRPNAKPGTPKILTYISGVVILYLSEELRKHWTIKFKLS